MISRRAALLSTGAALAGAAWPWSVRAAEPLRVASVAFGSLAWLLETIRAEGLDKKHGLALDVVEIANNQASAITLFGGSADVIVTDWPWALRQRAMGEALRFSPFSASLGSVMVAAGSDIKDLAGLKDRRLGVAGSAVDKSWLLLRAYSRRTLGTDVAELAKPQYGAAPLLFEQMKDGRIDAVLNFWTYSARLAGAGFRPVISMRDVMEKLGIEPQPALVGFVWKESTEEKRGADIEALLAAVAEGNAILAKDDAAWERLRPQLRATDDAEFKALVAGYRAGIPGPWTEAEMKSSERLMTLLQEGGDTELAGNGTRFDPKLFRTPRS